MPTVYSFVTFYIHFLMSFIFLGPVVYLPYLAVTYWYLYLFCFGVLWVAWLLKYLGSEALLVARGGRHKLTAPVNFTYNSFLSLVWWSLCAFLIVTPFVMAGEKGVSIDNVIFLPYHIFPLVVALYYKLYQWFIAKRSRAIKIVFFLSFFIVTQIIYKPIELIYHDLPYLWWLDAAFWLAL